MRTAFLVATLVALASPGPAEAWCRMTTSLRFPTVAEPCVFPDPTTDPPEQFLEWRRPCSSLAVSVTSPSRDLTEEEVLGVLGRSIATWEAVTCDGEPLGVDIELLSERSTCDAPLYRDDGGNVGAVMFVTDWVDRMYDAGAFAVTTVWHRRSTGEILDVDMEFNELRGPYGICPPEGCDERPVDLENVTTHELGHYLGVAHSEEPMATMFASALAGETIKRDLHADDIAGLCEIYPPGSPGGECDFTPRGGLDLDCEQGCSVTAPGRRTDGTWVAAILAVGFALRRRR